MVQKSIKERFWEKVDISEGCWNWIAWRDRQGYGRFRYLERPFLAHRFSWILENGDIPDGFCVLHKCDNPSCVRPDHLFLGTNMDNVQDKIKKGRQTSGENHPTTRLRREDVEQIRLLCKSGGRNKTKIARQFGISRRHVYNIINYNKWKN